MIGLIGIRKNTPIEHREKLTIHPNKIEEYSKKLLSVVKEAAILSTCNRTEIYFNDFSFDEKILKKIFDILNWDYDFREYVFLLREEDAIKHLFEVCCGFHSKIVGEDQILGQVKDTLQYAIDYNSVSKELHRLFQEAITCGKKFKNESRLYEIPVSSASIVANESINRNLKRYMVMGYGDVGKLVVKYLTSHDIEQIYLVVRNQNIKKEIYDERIKVISFEEKINYIDDVECIIGCTSAPHPVLKGEDINPDGNKLLIYDLAVPRDISEEVNLIKRVEVYNIDTISSINDDNKKLRVEKMNENKYILRDYLNEYNEWLKLRGISPEIQKLKELGKSVYEARELTFKNKCKDEHDIELANMMIKSTSDFYVNKAIKVLKEETLKGREKECLDIIQKIFQIK